MIELANTLNQCGEALKGDNLTQEALDEWVQVCNEIEQWAIDTKAEQEK